MYIEIIDETHKLEQELLEQTRKLLEFAAKFMTLAETKEMRVTFVENQRSQEINREYRQKDQATDVISLEYQASEIFFELAEEVAEIDFDPYIGEIFINIDRAKEQAKDYGHSLRREYGWLCVHGFLHINGYDHYQKEEEIEMFALQEEILKSYGLTR
ncbi:MAG: rRNA maturation RNase YbeY [Lactovum sp.]